MHRGRERSSRHGMSPRNSVTNGAQMLSERAVIRFATVVILSPTLRIRAGSARDLGSLR